MQSAVEDALQKHFGFATFRPHQREIVETILSGRSVLGVLPTSAGKSICYELPAVLLPGKTLVVSPLISLMKDQVDALHRHGIEALSITSSDSHEEVAAKIESIRRDARVIVYAAPERLWQREFLEACRSTQWSLLAIDEAHCISHWGHDFRPHYRLIPYFHESIGSPPVVALTATATATVQDDIAAELKVPLVRVVAPMDRPNIGFGVVQFLDEPDRRRWVARFLKLTPGSIIAYTTFRKEAEAWAEFLVGEGEEAIAYHGGMEPEVRARAQAEFMEGRARIVVATNAFGMGIDKADVRVILHLGVPDSIESYIQEAGRAGRDGLPSMAIFAVVLRSDLAKRERLLRLDDVDEEWALRKLEEGGALPPRARWYVSAYAHEEERAKLLVSYLAERRLIEPRHGRDPWQPVTLTRPLERADVEGILEGIRRWRAVRTANFENLRAYLHSLSCRRETLLAHFGQVVENHPRPCCDMCHGSWWSSPIPHVATLAPFVPESSQGLFCEKHRTLRVPLAGGAAYCRLCRREAAG